MKHNFYIPFLLFIIISLKSFASDPGPNYGCVIQGSPARLYFSYSTDGNPFNWGANPRTSDGLYHVYNNNSNNYDIYNDTQGDGYHCGVINSKYGEYNQVGEVCFVSSGGGYIQGDLATYSVNNPTYCGTQSLPIDSHAAIIVVLMGIGGFLYIKKYGDGFLDLISQEKVAD